MGSEERKSDSRLIEETIRGGSSFEFFALVHRLHRLSRGTAASGELGPVREEPVRFRQSIALQFHPSDVESIKIDGSDQPVLTSTFMGLYGASSPLATHFSEDVLSAEMAEEPSLREFYDAFHHRLLGLFYRTWKKYRFSAGFRHLSLDSGTRRFLCFVGVDGHAPARTHGLDRLQLLRLAPLLSMRARPARVLELAVSMLLPGIPNRIEPFISRRAIVDSSDKFCLGVRNNRLGLEVTLGGRVLDRSSRFRLHLGPVDYSTCEALMPGGKMYSTLRSVVEQFTRGTLECEVAVLVDEGAEVGYVLGSQRGSALGVTTRLRVARDKGVATRMTFLIASSKEEARATLVTGPLSF